MDNEELRADLEERATQSLKMYLEEMGFSVLHTGMVILEFDLIEDRLALFHVSEIRDWTTDNPIGKSPESAIVEWCRLKRTFKVAE